ncbi:YybH family protein [Noviherbaspirillum saxi]|uniref:SgcJ/EcaC family oxidoreductase n=1 Tax=Noviherbaspirillum saxi TaxID=2320863 RepID=A0A3A3FQE4_9BURK|nr:SgcJ/EcaC family oxidoreductase [Noviherbaspirillum saxi]RJF97690.1 SgcJ/EcaC family oxidoreductase [Noviherbaspirillum saxi]
MDTDEQAIRKLFSDWHNATANGNVEALGPLMSDDVIFLTPGQPPMRGREAFLDAFREGLQQFRIEPEGTIEELQIMGKLAYCWTHLCVNVTPLRNGLPMRRCGNTLTIFRKQADGRWVLIRDANLLTSQPASPG